MKTKTKQYTYFVEIAIYAIRYTYTRKSVGHSIVCDWIKNIGWIKEERARILYALKDELKFRTQDRTIDKVNEIEWNKLRDYLDDLVTKEKGA